MKVNVRNNNVNKALSVFKSKTKDIVREVRERQEYEKPSEKRKRQHRRAVARERKRYAKSFPSKP
jgi:small subunit ribosomal protein S21